jgi:hypothetical protein
VCGVCVACVQHSLVPHAHANAQIKRALPKKLYAPKSICILSRYSFTLFFRDWLCGVYSLSKELPHSMIDAFIVQLMDKVQTSPSLVTSSCPPPVVSHLQLMCAPLRCLCPNRPSASASRSVRSSCS